MGARGVLEDSRGTTRRTPCSQPKEPPYAESQKENEMLGGMARKHEWAQFVWFPRKKSARDPVGTLVVVDGMR